LVRDNDGIYGHADSGPPWQNTYVERLIGTLRRNGLDHVLILANGICGEATRRLRTWD
jgi:hypothetical protein